MKMNFLMGASLAGSLLASTASFAAADTVVAIVDGKNITFEEVMKQKDTLGKELKGVPEDKLFPLLQNKVVNDIIIEKAARESNIAEKEEVKKALEMMTQQFLIQAFLADKIKGTIEDGDVKKKYEDLVANFPDEKEAKLRHILVSDKSKLSRL
jgi:peptidyl-prolyl cis-trans isomerase C